MQEAKQTETKGDVKRQRLSSFKMLRTIVLVAIVFGIGHGFGTGQFSLASSSSASKDLPADLDYSSIDQLYDSLKENYDGKLTEAQLIEGLKHGLAEATNDPYTTYFTPKEAKTFNDDRNNTFSGIGAELGKDKNDNIEVIAPISGKPAEKAGLKAKDVVATINGKTTSGMSVYDAVQAIRGKAGTKVKLQVIRGGTEPVELTITREEIQVPSVTHKSLANGIGYIKVANFASDTGSLIDEAAEALKGSKSIILDMRNNPGGDVDAALAVSNQWLPSGKIIMQEKRGKVVIQSYQSTGGGSLTNKPSVVLVNEGSASAAEIVAAALSDNKQAHVIGEKTYGKGVVQRLINFRDGSQLKVTVASWFRPNGDNIDKKGITPSQIVKLAEDATPENDNQLQAAEAYLAR